MPIPLLKKWQFSPKKCQLTFISLPGFAGTKEVLLAIQDWRRDRWLRPPEVSHDKLWFTQHLAPICVRTQKMHTVRLDDELVTLCRFLEHLKDYPNIWFFDPGDLRTGVGNGWVTLHPTVRSPGERTKQIDIALRILEREGYIQDWRNEVRVVAKSFGHGYLLAAWKLALNSRLQRKISFGNTIFQKHLASASLWALHIMCWDDGNYSNVKYKLYWWTFYWYL